MKRYINVVGLYKKLSEIRIIIDFSNQKQI